MRGRCAWRWATKIKATHLKSKPAKEQSEAGTGAPPVLLLWSGGAAHASGVGSVYTCTQVPCTGATISAPCFSAQVRRTCAT